MILSLSLPAYADNAEVFAEPLGLDSVLRESVATNPQILEALEVYEALIHEVRAAESGYKPNVGTEFSVGQQYTNGASSDEEERDLTASSAGIYARQNLFNGFGTDNYVNETKARLMAAAYDVLDVANNVFIETAEAYIGVLKERELLTLAEENVETQGQILKQIIEKTEAGFGRKSDMLNSESRVALARANVISQQQNLKQAVVKFHKQLGRFAAPDKFLDPSKTYEFAGNVDDVVELAFNNYPALNVAKYNVLTKKFAMKRTQALYYPTLDAELRADYDNNTGGDEGDTKSYSAMLYLKYNFYDGGQRSAEKKKNYREILKEHQRTYIERRNLNESVRLAWNIKESEDKKYEYLKNHVGLSTKTLEAFKEEYQLGRRTLPELLDVENENQAAKTAFVESKYASLIAYYRVMFVTGVLLYEHRTDLFEKVGLTDNKIKLPDLSDYQVMENNRDADTVKDTMDQCDNSVLTETGVYGCADNENVSIGYSAPENAPAYIKPKESALTLEPESLGEPVSLGEPEKVDSMGFDASAEEQTVNFSNILFKLNSSKLTKDSYPVVDAIAAKLKTMEGYTLQIVGHTDSSGNAEFNKKLSAERAKSVYNRLVRKGVPKENITTYGKGEELPLYSNATRDGRVKNRRIEFKLTHLKQHE